MQPKIIALADCNSFYASCEQVFNPRLRGQPVIVLSNNDGCVVARSAAAKAVGIKMGEPFFKIQYLVQNYQVQVFSSNYALYGDLSNRVMSLLAEFTPQLEIYSIDEAFMELPRLGESPSAYLQQVRQTITRSTGIPISVGAASTKTLAKVANQVAKQQPAYQGVLDLSTQDPDQILMQLPIEEIWGVGHRLGRRLRSFGLKTALDLKHAAESWIRQEFGVVLLRTVLELRGIACIPLQLAPMPRKSITCSRSFGRRVTTIQELKEAIATYTSRAAEKLRRERLVASALQVFILTNRFQSGPQYSNSTTLSLIVATDDTSELIHAAFRGLEAIFRMGFSYNKAGVTLLGLGNADLTQLGLLDQRDRERSQQVMGVMDAINQTLGSGTLQLAAAGLPKSLPRGLPKDLPKGWRIKSQRRSPRYTTCWQELPIVKA